MDWDEEGLLDGLEDEAARTARSDLLDELCEDGVPVEDLRRAVAEGRLVLLPVERALAGPPRYSAREVAEKAGVDLDYLVDARKALGLPFPDPDERALGDEELEAAQMARRFLDAGFSREDIVESSRVLGRGMADYAESMREAFAQALLQPGDDEAKLARRLAEATESTLPIAGPWLAHVFALHLRQRIRSDVITDEERASGKVADSTETAVAFADLVGFTELGETIPVEELGGIAGRLTLIADRVVEPPVRVVKQIGDAVMLVSPEPEAMVRTALALIEAAADEDGFPPLRAGVAFGPAVNRWGDWFGSTVNVANRLTERARPGSVLTTREVRDEIGEDGFAWSTAGEKKLKGLSSPIKTYRARPPGSEDGI